MRKVVLGPGFKRAFRRLLKKNPSLQSRIEQALFRLARDLNDPSLKTHRLSGKLQGLFACSCGYDCRIVFKIEKQRGSAEEVLLLVNIGSHDEVY